MNRAILKGECCSMSAWTRAYSSWPQTRVLQGGMCRLSPCAHRHADFHPQKQFSCEITGHMNLNYFEALKSEVGTSSRSSNADC